MTQGEVLIDNRHYKLLTNVKSAFNPLQMREKYDPYLDQYDYLVGDISSDHLRLKGFFNTQDRVPIDKKANTIVDYLAEYVNPGSAYFVLALAQANEAKEKCQYNRHHKGRRRKSEFKTRRVHKVVIKPHQKVVIKDNKPHHGHFVIRKRGNQS